MMPGRYKCCFLLNYDATVWAEPSIPVKRTCNGLKRMVKVSTHVTVFELLIISIIFLYTTRESMDSLSKLVTTAPY